MTLDEVISRIKAHIEIHKLKEPQAVYTTEALNMAIESLKEIQLYKDGKLCLVPEDVYSKQCCELDAYKEIGTVEKCREAAEKQKPKKILPLTYGLLFENGWRHKCPNCGCAVGENIYHPDVTKDYEFCSMCGQAIYE